MSDVLELMSSQDLNVDVSASGTRDDLAEIFRGLPVVSLETKKVAKHNELRGRSFACVAPSDFPQVTEVPHGQGLGPSGAEHWGVLSSGFSHSAHGCSRLPLSSRAVAPWEAPVSNLGVWGVVG